MRSKLFNSSPVWQPGMLLIRVFAGILIIKYGKEIFEPWNMKLLEDVLASSNFPMPRFMAYLAKGTEFFGGILLVLGLFTRLVTIPLAICMAVIMFKLGNGSIFENDLPFIYLLLFMTFFFQGPGKWSLDYVLFNRNQTSVNKN